MKLAILDLDGTLYRGSTVIPGSVDAVQRLARVATIRYLTNNSTATPGQVAQKLCTMGFPADEELIVTSAMGAAWRLQGTIRRAYVVGEHGLHHALASVGIEVVDASADAVVVGLCRTATYDHLAACQREIRNGARFFATNRDATYPVEDGAVIPGAGTLVAAVATAAEQEPEVIGKPEPYLVEEILRQTGVAAEDAVMIGDRPDTDIEAARRAGVPAVLVLSGVCGTAPEGLPSYGSISDFVQQFC